MRLVNAPALLPIFLCVGAQQIAMSSPTATNILVTEGDIDFAVPHAGKSCKTHYKLFGNLTSGVRPLVALHGGPGAQSEYLEAFSDLTRTLAMPLVVYDQLGNGLSTHLPEKMGDAAFWTLELFMAELDNVLAYFDIADNFALFGHSWGGMLGAEYAIDRPKGLKRLVLASAPASKALWYDAELALRKQLPQEVQDVLDKHEAEGTTDDEEYLAAVQQYYARYGCRLDPMPRPVARSVEWLAKDPTVSRTMTRSLRNWTIVDRAHKISVPTLLANGRFDMAQDNVMKPFYDKIRDVQWVQFERSSHMAMWEERVAYMNAVGEFLSG